MWFSENINHSITWKPFGIEDVLLSPEISWGPISDFLYGPAVGFVLVLLLKAEKMSNSVFCVDINSRETKWQIHKREG